MRVWTMTAGLVASVALVTGCSSVQGAVDTAQGVVEQADALVAVASDVAAACGVAAAAWAPGVSPEEARSAITEATGMLDDVLTLAPDVPGVQEIDELLTTAQDSLTADSETTSLGVSRSTLETACAVFTLGG